MPAAHDVPEEEVLEEEPLILTKEAAMEALEALAAETELAIKKAEELDSRREDVKPQRITPSLIASRCLEKAAVAALPPDDLAETLMDLTRLRLDRLRIDSLDGLDICSSATHLMLQHNLLMVVDGLEFFDRLQYLVVSHNQLTQISGVAHLTKLQYFDASHNGIAHADPGVLPVASLMALELTGNPCTEARTYRPELVAALPQLLYLDESGYDVNAAQPPAVGDGDGSLEARMAELEANLDSAELTGSGYDVEAEAARDLADMEADASGVRRVAPAPLDAADLYSRALEAYSVNEDGRATQDKISAIRARTQERRREFAELEAMGAPAFNNAQPQSPQGGGKSSV